MTNQAILIVEATAGDWMGVYLGNDLVYQGHDIEPGRLLEIVGVSHTRVDDLDMQAEGWRHLPRTRGELPGFGGGTRKTS